MRQGAAQSGSAGVRGCEEIKILVVKPGHDEFFLDSFTASPARTLENLSKRRSIRRVRKSGGTPAVPDRAAAFPSNARPSPRAAIGALFQHRSCSIIVLFHLCTDFRMSASFSVGITCDGCVMAETAEICGCDGVMDRIAYVFF
jgi:hypothetical protein